MIRKDGKPSDPQTFANTPGDRTRLVKKLAKLTGIRVCLEATGAYHFDLAIGLHDVGVLLMVVNPKAAHNFAKVLMKNSKTDAVDAHTLAEFAARMDFSPWTRPSDEKLALHCFARRIDSITSQKAAAKNHFHALSAHQETPKAVLKDAKLVISQLEKRIGQLTDEALALIGKYPELKRILQLLIGIKGVGNTSAQLPSWVNCCCFRLTFPIGNGSSLQGLTLGPLSPAKASTRRQGSPRRETGIFVRPFICLH